MIKYLRLKNQDNINCLIYIKIKGGKRMSGHSKWHNIAAKKEKQMLQEVKYLQN